MSANLNDSIIDYYLITDTEIRKNLKFLTDFMNRIDQPFDDTLSEKGSKARLIAKIALKRFQFLESQTQQEIFDIAHKLTRTNLSKCYDLPTRSDYEAIVDIWASFSYLQKTIHHMSIFLTPAYVSHPLSIQELDRAQCLISFAVQYFKFIDNPIQMHIGQLAHLVKIPPLPNLLEPPHASYYQTLVCLFQNPLPPISPPPPAPTPFQPLIWRQDTSAPPLDLVKKFWVLIKPNDLSEDDFTLVPFPSHEEQSLDKESCEQEQKEKECIRKLQLNKICSLSQQICQHYLPLSWLGTDFQQQEFIKEFGVRFPEVAKKIFFLPPVRVSNLQFQTIYQCLTQGIQFLKIINKAENDSLQLTSDNLQQPLLHILENTFERWHPKESPMDAFISLIVTNSCIQLIERFFQPDNLYFILERLLHSEPWDLEDFNQKKIPLEAFPTDETLTKQLGDTLENLGKELIILGNPQWSANAVSKAVLTIIQFKKYEIARKIQQALHQIKSAPCSMAPLLVVYRILFSKEQNNPYPSWYKWQDLASEEKKKIKENIENQLNERLYQIVLKEIGKQSQFASWMIDQTSSIKTFCQTLTQRIWQLCQKDKHIKLLALYLLQGAEKALQNKEIN